MGNTGLFCGSASCWRAEQSFTATVNLNLAPLNWGRLIGAYVAIFFFEAQIISLVVFRTAPTTPIIIGRLFILAGGMIIAFGSGRPTVTGAVFAYLVRRTIRHRYVDGFYREVGRTAGIAAVG